MPDACRAGYVVPVPAFQCVGGGVRRLGKVDVAAEDRIGMDKGEFFFFEFDGNQCFLCFLALFAAFFVDLENAYADLPEVEPFASVMVFPVVGDGLFMVFAFTKDLFVSGNVVRKRFCKMWVGFSGLFQVQGGEVRFQGLLFGRSLACRFFRNLVFLGFLGRTRTGREGLLGRSGGRLAGGFACIRFLLGGCGLGGLRSRRGGNGQGFPAAFAGGGLFRDKRTAVGATSGHGDGFSLLRRLVFDRKMDFKKQRYEIFA